MLHKILNPFKNHNKREWYYEFTKAAIQLNKNKHCRFNMRFIYKHVGYEHLGS